jgi:biotin transport system substrate-specific component
MLVLVGRGGSGEDGTACRAQREKGATVHPKELRFYGASRYSLHSSDALARALGILAFVLFTGIGAQLSVDLPFTPVPITMQTLFVVLAGVSLGPRDGFYAMLSYLALGLAGAPVFAGFSFGPAVLIGPTGGYLISFPAAAMISGYFRRALGSGRFAVFASSVCGMAVILLSGACYLALVSGLPFAHVAALGIAPFVAGELAKALIASVVSAPGAGLRGILP